VALGRARRLAPIHDSTLSGYTARADGRIVFFVDREDGGRPFPLRIDQVSLDLYWTAPDRARQVVRAQRNEELFPLLRDFTYYLDRLSVLQNGFGDEIQVGGGLDVRAVPHPLAPGSERVYDFRMGDQLRLALGGVDQPVVVREIEVRPKAPDLPGFIGTLMVDETTSAIVRLDFTFTPASYIDPRNDAILVSVEQALWEGRFWLPYRQVVRVRREVPEFDLPIGTVIQAELEVLDYTFTAPPPGEAPRRAGTQVVFPPDGVGDTTRFERTLSEELLASGIVTGDLRSLETEAISALRQALENDLTGWRPGGTGSSTFIRATRVEGLFTGVGAEWQLPGGVRVGSRVGWAWGAERATGGLALAHGLTSSEWALDLSWDEPWDSDVASGAPSLLNTGAVLAFGSDWTDPIPVRSAALRWETGEQERFAITLLWEEHRSRALVWDRSPIGGSSLRPLRPAEVGTRKAAAGTVALLSDLGFARSRIDLSTEVGEFEGGGYVRALGSLSMDWEDPVRSWGVSGRLRGGVVGGDPPSQLLWYLGGRGTLPGYGFRAFSGRAFAIGEAELVRGVVPTWVDLRLVAGGGRVSGQTTADLVPLGIGSTGGWKSYTGMGAGLLGGAVRVHYYRGLDQGRGEWVLSVDPRWAGS